MLHLKSEHNIPIDIERLANGVSLLYFMAFRYKRNIHYNQVSGYLVFNYLNKKGFNLFTFYFDDIPPSAILIFGGHYWIAMQFSCSLVPNQRYMVATVRLLFFQNRFQYQSKIMCYPNKENV